MPGSWPGWGSIDGFAWHLPVLALLAGAVAGVLAAATIALAGGRVAPVAAGLEAPRGLAPLEDGSLLVSEVLGGRLLRITPGGAVDVVYEGIPATMGGPADQYPVGVSSAVRAGDVYYYVVGEFFVQGFSELYRLEPGKTPEPVTGQEIVNRFPSNPLTNPYDLAPAPGGGFYVTDGGKNTVLHVSGAGGISMYARFPDRENPLYPEEDIHPRMDVVPTGLAYGPDGALYVASFTGFPYPPGEATVYRLEDRNGDGDALDPGESAVYARGFSTASDLAFDSRGALLVTEFSEDMRRLVQEFTVTEAGRVPGRLVRWRDGRREVLADGLVSPTSVAVANGRIFVSEEFAGRVGEVAPLGSPDLRDAPRHLPVATGVVVALVVLAAGQRSKLQ